MNLMTVNQFLHPGLREENLPIRGNRLGAVFYVRREVQRRIRCLTHAAVSEAGCGTDYPCRLQFLNGVINVHDDI